MTKVRHFVLAVGHTASPTPCRFDFFLFVRLPSAVPLVSCVLCFACVASSQMFINGCDGVLARAASDKRARFSIAGSSAKNPDARTSGRGLTQFTEKSLLPSTIPRYAGVTDEGGDCRFQMDTFLACQTASFFLSFLQWVQLKDWEVDESEVATHSADTEVDEGKVRCSS